MELLYMLLTDTTQVIQGKMYILGGGWDTLTPHQLQGAHLAYVAAAVSVGWAEMGREHTFKIALEEKGEPVGPLSQGTFNVPKPDVSGFIKRRTFMISLPVQLPLANAGDFHVVLSVDGKPLGKVCFTVAGFPALMGQRVGSS